MPNFRPDTGGWRWSLVQVASSIALRGVGRGAVFPVYTTQAPGCSIWSVPCSMHGSSPRVFHKSADSAAPAFCAFLSSSSSGSQELDWRTLPSMVPASVSAPVSQVPVPSPLRIPSPSPHPSRLGVCTLFLAATLPVDVGCRPSRISGSLWLETGGLFAVW